MSKELPYFKFEPAEYLTKDISFCSLAAQGLFINLCSYYWQRGCNLTKDQFLRRLNYEQELTELIQEGVVDVQGNDIKIKFLDVQLIDACKSSKTNSVNGSKGGRPRKIAEENPNESETKPKLNPIESQTKGIRKEEIREEKKREENNINNANFSQTSKTDMQWIETVAMQTRIKPDLVVNFIDSFESHLITMEEQKQTTKDFKTHFTHWLNKQDLSHFKTKTIGKTNQV